MICRRREAACIVAAAIMLVTCSAMLPGSGSVAAEPASLLEPPPTLNDDKVYWTDGSGGRIRRANLDGTDVEDFLTGLDDPTAIAVDESAKRLYWVESQATSDRIRRVDVDGTNLADVVTQQSVWSDLAIDTVGGRLYWPGTGGPGWIWGVWTAGMDGAGVGLVQPMSTPVGYITLDPDRQEAYTNWFMTASSGEIDRWTLPLFTRLDHFTSCPMSGATPDHFPKGVAVDPATQMVYWICEFREYYATWYSILRADPDGGNKETIRRQTTLPIRGLCLDAQGGVIYYCYPTSGTIWRCQLDGSGAEEVVSSAGDPFEIVVVREGGTPIPAESWGVIKSKYRAIGN